MLFASRELRIEKKLCPLCTQDLGRSFSQYGPPGRQITYIYIVREEANHWCEYVKGYLQNIKNVDGSSVRACLHDDWVTLLRG